MSLRLKLDVSGIFRHLMKDLCIDRNTVAYVARRLTNEGLHFATVILPKFAKAVLAGIRTGKFPSERKALSEFSWKGALPNFCRGLLLQIFDRKGELLSEPDPVSLWVIRQLCEYCYKLTLPYDDRTLAKSLADFLATESSLQPPSEQSRAFIEKVRKNVETFYRFPTVDTVLGSYRPRFGPGSFSLHNRRGNESWNQIKATTGVRTTVPDWGRGISGYFRSYPASPERIRIGPDTSDHSELLFVPKDSRGPRVIIREPLHLLMLQMSYFDWMVDFCERETANRVNFRSQDTNRDLARAGSLTGEWSTLDLKEASDRVSVYVIRRLFRNVPVMRYFLSKRSKTCLLPSGETIQLNKLAGMGSGLTFATMAFLIHCSISTALQDKYGSYRAASRNVYVYGDDIIVRTEDVPEAVNALELVDLIVNADKSFTAYRPGFRESCGGDFMIGNEVAPVRLKLSSGVKSSDSARKIDADNDGAILQLERHVRELISGQMFNLAEYYYQQLECLLGKLPAVSGNSVVLGRWKPEKISLEGYEIVDSDWSPFRKDTFGQYVKWNAYVPKPVRGEPKDPNPYFFLGKKFTRSAASALERLISPEVAGGSSEGEDPWSVPRSDFFGIEEPRSVRLRRRKVNPLQFCG